VNQVRTRTASRNPVLRLLFVGLAFIIFNLYIALRQHIAICLKNPIVLVSKARLTLRRMIRMIAHAVEKLFDLAEVVFRHERFALS
jgi:putative transposase